MISQPPASGKTALPLTILIITKNEAENIGPCLKAIGDFAPVIVIDSHSEDNTAEIAQNHGARLVSYQWNGQYPKKRQWALDHLDLPHGWVLFIDADERLTQKCKTEIIRLFQKGPDKDGYYIKALYKIRDKVCHHGFKNNKLVLFKKNTICFPVIDDLTCPGMGEIEGHYQPAAPDVLHNITTGQIRSPIIHLALRDEDKWRRRHADYARWAACMTRRKAWPPEKRPFIHFSKNLAKNYPKISPFLAFAHSFVLKSGWLDGKAGWKLACSRFIYYQMIAKELANKNTS